MLRPRIEPLSFAAYVAMSPVVAVGVIVLGVVAFLPFHAIEALGVPDRDIVPAHAALCVAVALRAPGRAAPPAPRGLGVVPAVLAAWFVAVLAALWRQGAVAEAPLKAGVIATAALAWVVLFVLPSRTARASVRRSLPLSTVPLDRQGGS